MADTYLEPHGLVGFTFDFFVNWRTRSISNRLWIKRIVEPSFTPWPVLSHDISDAVYQCDDEGKVKQLCGFADRYGMSCHYFLFKESDDWENSPSPIVAVSFGADGLVTDVREVELSILMGRIQAHAGGPVPVGAKGLILGLSTLECYLANDKKDEGAAWPGDADLVLVDSNFTPHAIIEFKKHTPSDRRFSFDDQKLSNYYRRGNNWSRDGRKYNRLAIFNDYLSGNGPPLPIIVVYYPVQESIEQVQLERVEGGDQELRTIESEFIPLPNVRNEESCRDFVASLLEMIES
ncbi:MAG: hypothetical protein OXH00_16660 [Candidatus Poribacteria bacterium]|nr:hypothetical protein [Candidatus Poribacteria bacterium]